MKTFWKIILALIVVAVIIFGIIHFQKSKSSNSTDAENSNLIKTYTNDTLGVSIKYPFDFTKDENYVYSAFGPEKEISGVKFTIPEFFYSGTNLSSDSYLSLESRKTSGACSAGDFLEPYTKVTNLNDSGKIYSYATTLGAGAGNRYEEYVYAIPGTSPCIAIRYMIHYGVFENYETGTVKEFDKTALMKSFDNIRHTLSIK